VACLLRCRVEEVRRWRNRGRCFPSPGRERRHAVGVPLSGWRARLQARATRWLRLGAGGRGGARARSRAIAPRAGAGGVTDAGRVRRGVSRRARGRARDDGKAPLAASEGGVRVRGEAVERPSLSGGCRLADDDPRGAPLRGQAGAPPTTRPRGQLGTAGRQPGQARGREPAAPFHREAAVRVLGRAGRARDGSRATPRADDHLRGRDRVAAGRVARTRAQGRRPRGPGRVRPPHAPKRADQDAEDRGRAFARFRCRRSRSQPSTSGGGPTRSARSCFRPRMAATSTSTTSATAVGGRHRGRLESRRFDASTICGTRSRPSRFVPASPRSTSPGTWEPVSP
jgi:hypothetical protein